MSMLRCGSLALCAPVSAGGAPLPASGQSPEALRPGRPPVARDLAAGTAHALHLAAGQFVRGLWLAKQEGTGPS